MIKCIASDMDGTLLNSLQQITAKNKQAIEQAQAQGVEFVVATGRSYSEARFVLDDAGVHCPIICVNGAEVRSTRGDVISTAPINKPLAKQTAKVLEQHDVYYEVYTNKGSFTSDVDKAVKTIINIVASANPDVDIQDATTKAKKRIQEGRVHVIENYSLLFDNDEYQIYKILVFSVDTDRMEAAKADLDAIDELAISSSGHGNLEINHHLAQKGIALESFVKSKGIEMAETMAIGDNFNDVSMLKIAGRSVAMGNAGDFIKSLCDVVTDTNNESGVGKAILEVL